MQQFYYIISILITYALSISQNEELRRKLYSLQDQVNSISTLSFQNMLIIQYLDTFSYIVEKYDNTILELMADLIKYLKTFSSPVEHSAAEIAVLCFVYNDICSNSICSNTSFLEQMKMYLNPYYEFLLTLQKEKKYSLSTNYKISDEKQLLLASIYLGPTALAIRDRKFA
jgi:hypothetical protein